MTQTRVRAFDGVRAFAILAVFASHTSISDTYGGWLGVDVFFVLSGFLITQILVREWDRRGTVSLRSFYIRRVLRLYPALLLLISVGFAIHGHAGGRPTTTHYALSALAAGLYVQDFFGGFGHTSSLLASSWSLAVEEQFYLVWPPILLVCLHRGWDLKKPLSVAAAAGLCLDVALIDRHSQTLQGAYYLPWTHAPVLLAGCALAFTESWHQPRLSGAISLITGIVLLLCVPLFSHFVRERWLGPELALVCILSCGLLHGLRSAPFSVAARHLSRRVPVYVGGISYGVYLFYEPLLNLGTSNLEVQRSLQAVAALVLILGVASVSYRFVETPFLKFKARYSAENELTKAE